MSLLRLPNELILDIADFLDDETSINALLLTCRRFAALLHNSLYKANAQGHNSKALGWAAEHGIEGTARYAIQFGSPVDIQHYVPEIGRHTAFAIACYFGHESIVRLLLEYGAEVGTAQVNILRPWNQRGWAELDPQFATALTLAVMSGRKNIVKLLLSKEHSVRRADHTRNWTPIYAAMKNGHISIVRLLVKRGWPLDLEYSLFRMAREGCYDVCKYLINIPKHRGKNWVDAALEAAAQNGFVDTFKLLGTHLRLDTLENSEVINLALKATKAGHFAVAEEVRKSMNLNDLVRFPNSSELPMQTMLLISAACGWCDVMNKILECGHQNQLSFTHHNVDQAPRWRLNDHKLRKGSSLLFPNQFTRDAFPLDLAAYYGRHDAVEILIRHKADVDPPPPGIASPLLFAIRGGHEKTVNVLLSHGASPHLITDHEGETPFVTAFESDSPEIVRLMIEAGKDGFEKLPDAERKSAFMYALKRGNVEFLNFLTQSGWIWDNAWKDWDSNDMWAAAMHSPAESISFLLNSGIQISDNFDYFIMKEAFIRAACNTDAEAIKQLGKIFHWGEYIATLRLLDMIDSSTGDMNAVRETASALCQIFGPELLNGAGSPILIRVRNRSPSPRPDLFLQAPMIDKYGYLKILLDLDIDPFHRGSKDALDTPLVKFAEAGDVTALKLLLDAAEDKGGFFLSELSLAVKRAREMNHRGAAALLDRVFYRTMYPVPHDRNTVSEDADGDDELLRASST